MSGKLKKWLAILAAAGITASGVTEFLSRLSGALPASSKLHAVVVALSTLVALCVAIFPVSIKKPDDEETPKVVKDEEPKGP